MRITPLDLSNWPKGVVFFILNKDELIVIFQMAIPFWGYDIDINR